MSGYEDTLFDPVVKPMDEPFAAVDAQTRITLQEELNRIVAKENNSIHHPRCR